MLNLSIHPLLICQVTLSAILLSSCLHASPVGSGGSSSGSGPARAAQAAAKAAEAGQLRITYGDAGHSGKVEMSEEAIERELNDPHQDWARVSRNPDFLLMNGDEQALQQLRQRRRVQGQQQQQQQQNALDILDAILLSGRPLYMESPEEETDESEFSRQQLRNPLPKRAGNSNSNAARLAAWNKRGKLMRLSLTDNIDVLREKLFMEIARRNRLASESQVSAANNGLATIG